MIDNFLNMTPVLQMMYRDCVTITGGKPVERNGATEVQDVVIVENHPVKLSLGGQRASEDGQHGTDAYDAKLFIDNGIDVPAGATIDVTDFNGRTTRYKRSSAGYTAYASHQEITMVRDEKATGVTNG